MSTREEKQRIDRDPANKCQAEGCGNTRRLNEQFCGLHAPDGRSEIERRMDAREQRLDQLEARVKNISGDTNMLELRQILQQIVSNLR